MKYLIPFLTSLSLLVVTSPLLAQMAVAEAQGKVTDADGNPLAGVWVLLKAKTGKTEYKGKSNKKGRFFVPGLYSPQGDAWTLKIDAEGLVPIHLRVESRNAQRVLMGNIEQVDLKFGQKLPILQIRPLGVIRIDIQLAPEAEVRAAAYAVAEAEAVAKAEKEGGGETVKRQRDPWQEALATAGAGDLEGALPLFKKAVGIEPEDIERLDAYARVLYQTKNLDLAEETILKSIELDPARVESRMILYGTYVSGGRIDSAQEALARAREIAPEDVRILKQMAFVADETGKPEMAIEAYEGIVALETSNKDAWAALGGLYAESNQLDKSEAAYQRVTELAPDEAHQVFFNIGALIMNKRDRTPEEVQKAIAAFRRAVEIKVDYATAHQQLAFALLGVGDRPGAKSALQNYVKYAKGAPDLAQMQKFLDSM